MSVGLVLALLLPIGFILVLALLFKLVPHSFWNQDEDKTSERVDLEVEGGARLSPEPYHMTWPTPDSKSFSSFGGDTPKAARPPQSPRVMTSLVSPIKTVCSPPKRPLQGQRLLHSPVVIPSSASASSCGPTRGSVEELRARSALCRNSFCLHETITNARPSRIKQPRAIPPRIVSPVSLAIGALEYLSPQPSLSLQQRREHDTNMLSLVVVICCVVVMLLLILAVKLYTKFRPRTRAVQPPSITLVGINSLQSENTIDFLTSYHLARPTPVSKAQTLSPIREESWMSVKSFTSSLTLGSMPQSPVILTSLVSPIDDAFSPPPALITPLPVVGLV